MASTITINANSPATPVVGTDEVTIASVLQHLQRVKNFDGRVGGTDGQGVDPQNRGLVTEPDQLVSGTITTASTFAAIAAQSFSSSVPGANTFVSQSLSGMGTVGIQIIGTWATQALQFEGTADGTNWTPIYVSPTNLVGIQVSSATLQGLWRVAVAGLRQIRVRAPTGTTFSVNPVVTFTASAPASIVIAQSAEDDGLGNIKVTMQTAFDSNVDSISVASTRATYRGVSVLDSAGANGGLASGVSALGSCFSVLFGSSTRIVRVTRVQIQGTAAAVAFLQIGLRTYSTSSSGGAATAQTMTRVDQNDAVATASLLTVTTAATEGTLVGSMESGVIYIPATGSATLIGPPRDLIPTGALNDKPIVLRTNTQYVGVCLMQAAVLPATYRIHVTWEWTESTT